MTIQAYRSQRHRRLAPNSSLSVQNATSPLGDAAELYYIAGFKPEDTEAGNFCTADWVNKPELN
jgi:hypothetical protein